MSFSIAGLEDVEEVCKKRKDTKNLLKYSYEHLESFFDVVICVENEKIPANRLILSCYSYFFESMFKSEMREKYQKSVEIQCVSGKSVKQLIEYIYSGSLIINSKNVCDLLSAADYLQIEEAKQFCLEFLKSAINNENCFAILAMADRYSDDAVKSAVEQYIADNFVEVSSTSGFKNLSNTDLVSLISKQDRCQVAEISIYIAIVAWIYHDEENRCELFHELLRTINLDKIHPDILENVISKENLIIKSYGCSKLLIEALNQHTRELKMKQGGTTILAFGGETTESKVIEVFSLLSTAPKTYPDLPDGRDSGCSVLLNDYIYFVGGRAISTEDLLTSSKAWRMNLKDSELEWSEIASMNVKRFVMGATVFKETLVVVGGGDHEITLSSGEYYLPILNTWMNISNLNRGRFGNALVTCKGCLYVIGGSSGGCTSSVECLSEVNGRWKNVHQMHVARKWLTAVTCNNSIYAIGGQSGLGSNSRLQSVEKYDVDNDKWTYVSDMKFKRVGCAACTLQGKIYVIGGRDADHIVKEIECFDPLTDKWSVVGKTDEELVHHCVVVV